MNDFIAPVNELGLPAPLWFLNFFKVLGYILHVMMMNIWFAGLPLAIILITRAKGNFKRAGERIFLFIPVIIALGINFGIVPLLFTQTVLYSVYYPAGILIAWPWLSVIPFVIIAYYGTYIYSLQLRKNAVNKIGIAAGWVSAILFIVVGFLFANNFSLMVNQGEWMRIYEETNFAGAVTGMALNIQDPSLFPRWLMMFGMAFMTTAIFLIVDSAFFADNESEEYKSTVRKFAVKVYAGGLLTAGIFGSWYIFGTFGTDLKSAIQTDSLIMTLFSLAAVSTIIPFALIVLKQNSITKGSALFIAATQFFVIVLNALSRQWKQSFEVSRIVDLAREPINTQWSSLIPFLIFFVIGASVIFWMVKQVVNLKRK